MSSTPRTKTIAVIGAGFSGTMTAVHLARRAAAGAEQTRIVLFERGSKIAAGVAYSTDSGVHYLNVPAGNMSAFEDDPTHFLRWTQANLPEGAAIGSGAFLPRGTYGHYLNSILEDTMRERPGVIEVRRVGVRAVRPQEAGSATRGSVLVEGDDGSVLLADRVVLALGNFLPAPVPNIDAHAAAHAGYLASPWQNDSVRAIKPDEPILIVGTGLTMVDVVMQLHAQHHEGRIIAISRHGLLPRPHRSPSRAPAHRDPPAELRVGGKWGGDAKSLVRIVREAVRDHAAKGTDWRDVITSLRPVTAHLWQKMPQHERERFLERVRSFWEVVRHRAAPEAAANIADLSAARHLVVRAGRIESVRVCGEQPRLLEAMFRPRGSGNSQTLRVARVINCLGPQTDVRKIADALVSQMLDGGVVTPDAFGTGIDCSESGAVIGANGRPSESIFVVGPMRKAQTWENTAVPELKKQAAQVAEAVMSTPIRATI